MKHISIRFWGWTLAATVLLAATAPHAVHAQGKPKAAAKVAPKIDAAAREILSKMVATYREAPSYSGNFTIATTGFPDRFALKARLSWARPGKFLLGTEDSAGTQRLVSDGESTLHTVSRQPDSYVRSAAREPNRLRPALAPLGVDGTALVGLLLGDDPLDALGSTLQSLTLGAPQDGADVVIAAFAEDGATGTVTYAVGQTDHILRSAALSQQIGDKTITSIETHRGVKLGVELPASTFDAAAPVGLESLEAFPKPPLDPRLVVGGLPFDFPMPDINGNPVSWEQLKGKVVLVDFWATWCPPCREEMPAVVNAYNAYKDEGFDIIGVSLDSDRNALDAFTQQNGMPWTQIFDGGAWESVNAKLFAVQGIPATMLIGRDGKIAAINVRGAQLTSAIERALAAGSNAE